MKLSGLAVAAGCCLLLGSSPAFSASGYQFTTISIPVGGPTIATAINTSGQITGYYTNSNGFFPGNEDSAYSWQGFLISNGNLTQFNVPGATWTKPLAIGDTGQIFGSFYSGAVGFEQAFAYNISNGQFTTLPLDLSSIGSNGVFYISGIDPTGSMVVGSSGNNDAGFLYANGKLSILTPPLADGQSGYALPTAVSAAGEIVGTYAVFNRGAYGDISNLASAPFSYLNGVYTPLDPRLTPTAVGPTGQILGSYATPNGPLHGAIFQNGTIQVLEAPNNYGDPLTPYSPPTLLQSINAAGQIVAVYGGLSFVATPAGPTPGEKASLYIDTKAASPVAGLFPINGWAIDNASAIVAVSISVDGAFLGNANYGGSRPDVCAVHPGQVGCPNVGWAYPLDTTILSDGPHTLQAVALSANGSHAAAPLQFTVASATLPFNNPVQMYLDVPAKQNASLSGIVTLSGWAFDLASPVARVTLMIDETSNPDQYFVPPIAFYGSARPDVCAARANANNCLNSGWTYSLDTTALSDGPHTLTISPQAVNGDQNSTTVSFIVANNSPIKAYVDQPTSNSGPVSGSIVISGWALDKNAPVQSIQYQLDGSNFSTGYVSFGGYRPDVCAVYPSSPACPKVGWSFLLDTALLANGLHSVTLYTTAYDPGSPTSYTSFTTTPVTFVVKNPTLTDTTRVFIDQPTVQAQVFWGQATFSGWALDDATNISNVQFFIDGNVVGSTEPSQPRPDICAVYPNRPGCADAGWNFTFNTLPLVNGVHAFTATAISQTGSQASASQSFTIANSTDAQSARVYIDSPGPQSQPLSGTATFSGWAINLHSPIVNIYPDSISNIFVQVDGQPVALTTPTVARPDVCAMYPNAVGCPTVGWTVPIDTTLFSNGVHKLSVTANTRTDNVVPYDGSSLQNGTASTFFTVANSSAASPIKIYVDKPASQTTPLSAVTSFVGWAIDSSAPIASAALSIDGGTPSPASYGASRPDVCAAFPADNGCPAANVGWSFAIDTTALANGTHTANMVATSQDGLHKTISVPFTVAN